MKKLLLLAALAFAAAASIPEPVQAAPTANLVLICTKAGMEGKFVGECTAGTPAGQEFPEPYDIPTLDSLTRDCGMPGGAGCNWNDTTGFVYRKLRDLIAAGKMTDTCLDALEPGTREVAPWSSATSKCKNWGAKLASTVMRVPDVTNTTGVVNLSWIAPTQNTDGTALTDLAGFYVYQGTSQTSLVKLATSLNAAARTLQLPLPVGTFYFSVSAYSPGGEGAPSGVISVTVTKPAPPKIPGVPTQFKATVTLTVP